MELISEAIHSHRHVVIESGTGSGKTICALVPSLAAIIAAQQEDANTKKRVVYLTRTNSQQRQVIFEFRNILRKLADTRSKPHTELFCIGIQGRHNLCRLIEEEPELKLATAEELATLCGDRKRATKDRLAGLLDSSKQIEPCVYFENVCNFDLRAVKRWVKATIPTTEELVAYCRAHELCPHEINRILIPEAQIIVAPYIYMFTQFIRDKLLGWLACELQDIILIVDEAHNLPDYARELSSVELSMKTLNTGSEEAKKFGDPKLYGELRVSGLCKKLKSVLSTIKSEFLIEDDGLVPADELEACLMYTLKIPSAKLDKIISNLITFGDLIRDLRRREGKVARSYVHAIGKFLWFWTAQSESEKYVKLVRGGDANPKLEIYCLDPAVATDIILETSSSVHMSGTLSPLEEYRDSIGLPQDTELHTFPSPFPPENRMVHYVTDVTTKYEELLRDKKQIEQLEAYVVELCNTFDKNIAVFFPSFNLLSTFLSDGICAKINRPIYIEEQTMAQTSLMELVETFKLKHEGSAVLFSVIGGRIAEGMDFPAEELEIVALVGIPYPKPTAKQRALQNYYELKFGKGWDYAVKAPTLRRILQSIGRLIRHETDRGVALILDKRAIHFKRYIDNLNLTTDIKSDLTRFFEATA
jgi:DNA excision repair protein ERCC-2